jgi:hypothetical protein
MRALVISSSLCICVGLAHADPPPPESARAHFAAGRKHVARQEYDAAIHEFELCYRLKPSAVFLFNIGQVARQAGETLRALDAFEAYLRESPRAVDRVDVERWIVALREAAEHERAARGPDKPAPPPSAVALTAPPPSSTPAPATSATATATATPATTALTASPPPAPPRRSRKTLWIALGSVGGALVLGGVATAIAVSARGSSTPAGYNTLGSLSLAASH